jgi:hypothetical protein
MKLVESICTWIGIIILSPLIIVAMAIAHLFAVIPCYYKLWICPFSPWKDNARWYHRIFFSIVAPHAWIYEMRVSFKSPYGPDYYVVGEPCS